MLSQLFRRRLSQRDPEPQAPDEAQGTSADSSEVHVFGDLQVVIGLTWTEVASAAEAKRIVSKNNTYLLREITGQLYLGMASKNALGVLAAGALVGRVAPNAFVYQQLADERYWICMLRDGIPMPSYDRVVAAQEAQQIFTDATAFMEHGTEIIGNVPVARTSLEDVLAAELGKKEIKECRLKKTGINITHAALSLLACTAVAAVIHFLLQHQEQLKNEERRLAMLRSMIQSQAEKEAQERRLDAMANAFKMLIENERKNFGQQGVARAQFEQCEKIRQSLPLTLYGYQAEKLVCDFNNGFARIEWQPINEHTRLADRTKLPHVIDRLNLSNPVIAQINLAPNNMATPAKTIDADVVKLTILDWAQRNISMRFDPDEDVTLTPDNEIKGMPGIDDAVRLGRKTTLHISASNSNEIILLDWAASLLNQYPIAFQTMTWTQPVRHGSQFQAQSTLYIRHH